MPQRWSGPFGSWGGTLGGTLGGVVLLGALLWALLGAGRPAQADAAPPEPRVQEGIEYCPRAGVEPLHLDLAVPGAPAPPGGRPMILLVHGGGWVAGSRQDYAPLIRSLARWGLVAASLDYRLAPQAHWPAQGEDIRCALRWMRHHAAQWSGRGHRLALLGGSAGAHLAALVALQPRTPPSADAPWAGEDESVQALILHGGGYELREPPGAPSAFSQGQHDKLRALLGRAPDAAHQSALSPLRWLRADAPPLFLVHGQRDAVVPVAQSRQLHAEARRLGVPAELWVIPDAGHADFGSAADLVGARLRDFLSRHLAR